MKSTWIGSIAGSSRQHGDAAEMAGNGAFGNKLCAMTLVMSLMMNAVFGLTLGVSGWMLPA